jgi:hypothetical protein
VFSKRVNYSLIEVDNVGNKEEVEIDNRAHEEILKYEEECDT